MNRDRKARRVGLVVGGAALGTLIGAVLAINIVIYAGSEQGYETSLIEVFDRQPVVGVIVVLVQLSCTVGGALLAAKRRRRA